MINRTLEYLTEELSAGLELEISDITLDNLKIIQDEGAQGLIMSLLNVEEESTLKNSPHFVRKNNQLVYKEPPVFLNLNILIAFEFEAYGTSLQRLGETVEFFQNKRWFTAENERPENPFPEGINKIVMDLQELSFEQMNHIWSIAGGTQFPSLLYKVRLVKIQPQDEVEASEINTIQLDSGGI